MIIKKKSKAEEIKELMLPKSSVEELEIEADLIHLRILDEIDRLMQDQDMSKKDLADALGTSKSYITQLFSSNKRMNLLLLAKMQRALNMKMHCFAAAPYEFVNIMRYDVRIGAMDGKKNEMDYGTIDFDPCMSESGVSAA